MFTWDAAGRTALPTLRRPALGGRHGRLNGARSMHALSNSRRGDSHAFDRWREPCGRRSLPVPWRGVRRLNLWVKVG